MVRVKFDVSGVNYSIERGFLDTGPSSKLTRLCSTGEPGNEDNVYLINRPPELFNAILTLYLIGELHIPMTSCPGAFLKEMEFWEIDPKYLSSCCYYKLQCHQEEQRTLTKFHRHIVTPEVDILSKQLPPALTSLRARIWSIVDYRSSSLLNKLYFSLTFIMILLSIMTISFGTCDMFRRNMTNCERIEYMEAAGMDHLDAFAGLIREQDCHNSTIPDMTSGPNGVAQSGNPNYGRYDPRSGQYDYDFIQINVPTLTNASDTIDPPTTTGPSWMSIMVPNMKVPIRVLVVLDLLTLVFFTIDFVCRMLSCPSILAYFRSIINIADIAALFGTYIHLIVLQAHKEERYKDDWIDVLALMQMLRSVRLFRVVRNITAARVLVYTLRQNVKDLSIVLLFLIVGICTFSSTLYILENKEYFNNIPMGWYWALITMTTVGYGDIIPTTAAGKCVACLCAMVGLLLFALTIPIFVNNFLALYRYANLKCFSRLSCKDSGTKTGTIGGDFEMREHLTSAVMGESPKKSSQLCQ